MHGKRTPIVLSCSSELTSERLLLMLNLSHSLWAVMLCGWKAKLAKWFRKAVTTAKSYGGILYLSLSAAGHLLTLWDPSLELSDVKRLFQTNKMNLSSYLQAIFCYVITGWRLLFGDCFLFSHYLSRLFSELHYIFYKTDVARWIVVYWECEDISHVAKGP